MRDLHNNIRTWGRTVVGPVAVGTTGTGQTGKIVDRQGYDAVEFIIGYGAVTATNAVFTATVLEGDVTGTMTSVADADLLGTELAAGLAAAATRTSGVSKLCSRRIGYTGGKRYVRVDIKSTVTAAAIVSAVGVLGRPVLKPTTNP